MPNPTSLPDDPLWYKDAVVYEIHVRAFYDPNGDGMGDFAGLTQKLDYLQDLGVTALWLLPFCPSPWKDDGYDISDYANVHPAYGTLRDFQVFLREAHCARPARHHRTGPQPHLRSARLVSALAPRRARFATGAITTSGAIRPNAIPKPASSSRTSNPPTGPGIPSPRLTTGTASIPTSRISTSTIPKCAPPCSTPSISGSIWASMASASTPCPTSTSARAPTAKIFPRPTRFCANCAPTSMPATAAACCWPKPTSGRRTPSPTSARATSATWPSTSR